MSRSYPIRRYGPVPGFLHYATVANKLSGGVNTVCVNARDGFRVVCGKHEWTHDGAETAEDAMYHARYPEDWCPECANINAEREKEMEVARGT